MAKFWTLSEFKNLKAEWDEKLKKSGFVDAEIEVNGFVKLRAHSAYYGRFGNVFRHVKNEETRQARTDYFLRLAQAFQLAEFEDDLDRLIMERTVEGKTIKEISDEIKSLKPPGKERTKHNRNTIRYIRRRYEKKWGIREWKAEQMVSRKAPIRS